MRIFYISHQGELTINYDCIVLYNWMKNFTFSTYILQDQIRFKVNVL